MLIIAKECTCAHR